MVYSTQAENRRDEAVVAISNAIKALSEIVVDECSGYDRFGDRYIETLHESLRELVAIKRNLRCVPEV